MARTQPVTLAAVADEAGVSRATAYRYFTDPVALTLEAALDETVASPEEIVGDARDVVERVTRVQRYLLALVRGAEPQFRLFLARSLDAWCAAQPGPAPQVRQGRRIAMYEHALEPLRGSMPRRAFDDLVVALSAVSGIESHVALEDVCRVDDEVADRVASRIVAALLESYMRERDREGNGSR